MISRLTINLIFSTFVTFYFSYLFVWASRKLFRLRHPRLLYFLYILPFLKVTLDLFISSHSHWSFLHHASILNAAPFSRTLSAYAFFNGLPGMGLNLKVNNFFFSLGDYLAEILPPYFMLTFTAVFIAITLFFLIKRILEVASLIRWSRKVSKESILVHNKAAYASDSIATPLVLGFLKSKILIPKKLLNSLSEKELESIVEHESAHIKWRDNWVNLLMCLIDACFWFVPFKKYFLSRAYFYRELACDQKTTHPEETAQALLKVTRLPRTPLFLTFSSTPSTLQKRIETLLNHQTEKNKLWKTLVAVLLFIVSAVFLFASQFFPF